MSPRGLSNLQSAPSQWLIRQKEQICKLLLLTAQLTRTSTLIFYKVALTDGSTVSSADFQKNAQKSAFEGPSDGRALRISKNNDEGIEYICPECSAVPMIDYFGHKLPAMSFGGL